MTLQELLTRNRRPSEEGSLIPQVCGQSRFSLPDELRSRPPSLKISTSPVLRTALNAGAGAQAETTTVDVFPGCGVGLVPIVNQDVESHAATGGPSGGSQIGERDGRANRQALRVRQEASRVPGDISSAESGAGIGVAGSADVSGGIKGKDPQLETLQACVRRPRRISTIPRNRCASVRGCHWGQCCSRHDRRGPGLRHRGGIRHVRVGRSRCSPRRWSPFLARLGGRIAFRGATNRNIISPATFSGFRFWRFGASGQGGAWRFPGVPVYRRLRRP